VYNTAGYSDICLVNDVGLQDRTIQHNGQPKNDRANFIQIYQSYFKLYRVKYLNTASRSGLFKDGAYRFTGYGMTYRSRFKFSQQKTVNAAIQSV
jgi:hypothetical protein